MLRNSTHNIVDRVERGKELEILYINMLHQRMNWIHARHIS